ncbi:uncharacterized protein A4U43_C01F15430 [Asparagus officinalis]|uniref:VHS domain-containing protein n=1 Tax=Asparagus officinalis TaxID=4686 RepID=A0A5P1FPT2_ASPOF|nr:TOM1-like protein 2 [Asparagus officinalis]ONK80238.1 uncharacterized protein A4U43_C01F15430 [Asparagus officinalis]
MASSMVDRATSDQLIGPDWAMNIEICDILNRDPGQAKDVVKGLKRRVRSKNPKVQLLALTLLETVIKNCGDVVHMHVAEKDVLHEMVKIIKKKNPDLHVKEKVLSLIDTWQEAFGGPRARYPQYYAAYQELLRLGAVFPQRSESSAPVLTPPQTQPLPSYPPSIRSPNHQAEPETSVASEFPTLSLTEMQNAQGIMDVLSEMLNALDPGNREGPKQEVIIDLVEQCRAYKQRVVQLVNTTSDEELLSKGLTLNDDLQRVLAKHDAIAAGISVHTEKPKSLQSLVDIDDSTASNKAHPDKGSVTSTSSQPPPQQLLLPAPPASNASSTPAGKADSLVDLLSGDDYSKPAAENPLALVPISGPVSSLSPYDENALALIDMFPRNNNNNLVTPVGSQLQPQPQQPPQSAFYSNGGIQSNGPSTYEQGAYVQGEQIDNANSAGNNQPQALDYGGSNGQNGAFPPPPWEAQPAQNNRYSVQDSQTIQNGQMGGNLQPNFMQTTQFGGMQPQPLQNAQYIGMQPSMMQNNQGGGVYGGQMMIPQHHAMYGGQMTIDYGYGQQPNAQFYDPRANSYPYGNPNELSQRMYGLSMQDNSAYRSTNSSYNHVPSSTSSLQQTNKPLKPEDKLFGDLLSMARSKTSKPGVNKVGSQ